MIERFEQVSRKTIEEDRIAICPYFGCKYIEKVKPLKLGFLGRRKYPTCRKHKISLVFIDEFIGSFIHAVEACLYDTSSLPPKSLIFLIKKKTPNNFKSFLNGWIYCIPIGRGGQIVPLYMDGLSKSYMKVLSKKQRKVLKSKESTKKSYEMLRVGLKKITREYTNFLQNLRKKSDIFYNLEELHPFPKEMRRLIQIWLKQQLSTINCSNKKKFNNLSLAGKSLSELKEEYDKILQTGTCALLLGKSPEIVTKGISAFEIFSAYHEFLNAGLCKELKKEDIDKIIMEKETYEEKNFKIKPEINHYNRWFTNRIQNYLQNLDLKIKFLFKPYISFSKMDNLFGLGKGYILGRRMKNKSKHIIAKSILNTMRENFNDHITNWIKSFPALKRQLFGIEKDIKKFIDEYEELLKPKPTPRYQMYLHHPNFNRYYFSQIDSKEKAYWLGFLFADGYITLEHKESEDYYRMGI